MGELGTGPRFHKIRGMSVSGGFLGGMEVEFDQHLNCIIGGRGAGKTTIIEFIRYALDAMPVPRRSTPEYKQIEKLVAGNLGTGVIRVQIETRDGLIYTVERGHNEAPVIFDEADRPTSLSLSHGSVFNVDIYGQNEIETIANSPSFQLDLIDKFIEREIKELKNRLDPAARELAGNASDVMRTTREIEELEETLAELPSIVQRLKAFEADGGEEAGQINKEIALKGLRDREKRTIESVMMSFSSTRNSIQELSGLLARQTEGLFDPDVMQGRNKEVLEKASSKTRDCAGQVEKQLLSMLNIVDQYKAELDALRASLEERHLEQDGRFRKLMELHETDKEKTRERTQLQRRQNELHEKARDLAEKKKILQSMFDHRRALLMEISELRDKRTELRNQVAKDLNKRLSPEIRVTITQFGNTEEYRSLLTQALQGAGRKLMRIVGSIIATMPPQEFSRIVRKNGVQEIIDHLDLDAERANWIVQQLKDTQTLYDIEAVDVDDLPQIELKDGTEYKDSTLLSTGQKCTTILPILLLESENPLLIDQPEDNLDNTFIYKTVVSRIREAKNRRQLVFVTHNPNIPVLGDAGKVLVMSSNGYHSIVDAQGTVDEVKDDVETILEGGKEAFAARRKRYGY